MRIMTPDPDDPVAAVVGKYAWIRATSDEMREEGRAFDIARTDEDEQRLGKK